MTGLAERLEKRAGAPLHEPRDAVAAISRIPYGRPSQPTPDAVVDEWQGTCSTKHLLLRAVLAERWPDVPVELWHRAYVLSPDEAERRWGPDVAALVPPGGLADVHTYAAVGGTVVDATFVGEAWDGRSPMPLHCGDGEDVPAGDDPRATKAALVAHHCDPAAREPFIAALARWAAAGAGCGRRGARR